MKVWLGLALLLAAAGAADAQNGADASQDTRLEEGRLPTGAAWRVELPANWNRTLLVYSHGYGGGPDAPFRTAPGDQVRRLLLARGYALAASGYAQDGWSVEAGLADQVAVLDLFERDHGAPARTIAWGESMGGLMTLAFAERPGDRFDGGIALCGSVGGVVGMLNLSLDGAFVLKTLLAPASGVELVNLKDERARNAAARAVIEQARMTPAGQARLALVAAVAQVPVAGGAGAEALAAADVANQVRALMASVYAPRQPLEARAGGNFSWNTGIDYRLQLAASGRFDSVKAVYDQAGLSLDEDLATLARAPRIAPDPHAVAYMKRFLVPSGDLRMPLLTISNPGDELTSWAHERALLDVARTAGRAAQLRQLHVNRPGHCVWAVSELLTGLAVLERRLDAGRWLDTSAESMNLTARSLGLDPPAFVDAIPPPFPRACTSLSPKCAGEP